MKKGKKFLICSLIVGLSSLLYIDFHIDNFKFSFAAVMFPLMLFIYDEFNPIIFGITSGLSLVFFRGLFSEIFQGIFLETFFYSIPEYIFYIIYGLVFYIFRRNFKLINHNRIFIISFLSDILSNVIEIYIRIGNDLFITDYSIIKSLVLVALSRAGLAWLILFGYKSHKLLIVKEEHDKRYKNFLKLTSQLKSEIYLMEKNMDYIENVMSNAYELFTNINKGKDKDTWADGALDIAKDIHEIKKEYGLVVAGIEDIMSNRLDNTGMYFNEIVTILKETLEMEIKNKNKRISIKYDIGQNFYTDKHYYFISILRNIIMNSVDSIEDIGSILLFHRIENNQHLFLVSDDGYGIDDEDLQYIFSPGYSTKVDYDTGQINRGLGLTLVENIIKVHLKGNIKVESEVGKGSTFMIYIPVEELEAT